jgi:PTS system nitrogen regulatory IIA component
MLGVSVAYLLGTAKQIHPDVVKFLRETPEAAEFMITAMKSGLAPEDFADLREALKDRSGKGFVRRATLPASAKKKKKSKKDVIEDLSEILDPALCVTGVIVQSKSRLFQRIAKLVTKRNKALSTEILLDRLELRERQAPTVVGGGVAIPHAFIAEVEKPIIGALYLKRAVPFSADGDGKVKTVFYVIGNESKPQSHISILARIARLCSTPEFLDAFAGARTNRDLYKTILKWDRRVGSV